ncbi:hypothetical protein PHISP_00544 [Aspergillus sp. HF37]|nr:hypothetical protein PHISP_00544 [Aspergillus sp. HF37]
MDGHFVDGAHRSLSSLSLPGQHGSGKRRLLLVYIHGFMGSEASFQDLPAHVHDLLTSILSESHVVYTRIYPRYKSHGEIQTAVNHFSAWLSPHETDDLDVILLGHSLGGILAADVALLPADGLGKQRHRILGLVNFDVPFLGLHPRVIPTGIGSSMPKRDIAAEDEMAGEQESMGLNPPVAPSPNFDPPFKNDVRLPQRGFFKGMMHFVNKNAGNVTRSVFDRAVSSIKFANCVNNHSELRARYRRLMDLEAAEYSPERVRFVNYYTASTGFISRKAKTKPTNETEDTNQIEDTTALPSQGCSETPSIPKDPAETATTNNNVTPEGQNLKSASFDSARAAEEAVPEKSHPPVDTTGVESPTTDQKLDTQSLSESVSVSVSTAESNNSPDPSKQKLRKFILLPSHHWRHNDNAHWMPILMEDMDEVTAHQSLFIPRGAKYDHLVGDTVALIEQWVQNDLSRRLLQESLD